MSVTTDEHIRLTWTSSSYSGRPSTLVADITAQNQAKSSGETPFVFEWYDNRVQEGLQIVLTHDQKERQHLVEIIEELKDLNSSRQMYNAYTDALQNAKAADKNNLDVELVMFAQLYIAGTFRGTRVFEW